jgi:hypothetical protein
VAVPESIEQARATTVIFIILRRAWCDTLPAQPPHAAHGRPLPTLLLGTAVHDRLCLLCLWLLLLLLLLLLQDRVSDVDDRAACRCCIVRSAKEEPPAAETRKACGPMKHQGV